MEIFSSVKTERIDWDDSQVVDRIIRQYENFPNAFQKEAIQNAWDARLDRREGKGWRIKIYAYKESGKTHLIVEDFGTKGMDKERWEAFLALWKPKKERLDAGGQGQGKFVLMGASNESILLVESVSDKISYRCKFLKKGRKSRGNESYSIEDFISKAKPLGHRGTKVWVYDAKRDFLEIIRSKEFIKWIQESWWQILGERFNAKIELFGKEIAYPELPSLVEESVLLEKASLNSFGRAKRLVLNFYEKPIPEIFQGIRTQRANMMITKLQFEVHDKEYQGRFSGYIEFDKDLEEELKDIEKSDHCNFRYESPWKEIKPIIREKAEEFVNKIVPSKDRKADINIRNLSQIIQKANQIINDYCPEILGGGTFVPPISRESKSPLRIKYLYISKREAKYGDLIKSSCTIINESSKNRRIRLPIELKRLGVRVSKEEYKLKISAGSQRNIRFSDIKLDPKNFKKGKYTLRVTIRENRHDIDTKSTSFYLETKREPVKRGFIKRVDPYHNTEEPVRYKSLKRGIIRFNMGHKDFENIWSIFSRKPRVLNKQVGFYIIRICLDEAVSELLRIKLKDAQDLDLDDLVRELQETRDKMYSDIYG